MRATAADYMCAPSCARLAARVVGGRLLVVKSRGRAAVENREPTTDNAPKAPVRSTVNAPKAHYCPCVPVAVVSVDGGGVGGGGGVSFGLVSVVGGAGAVVVGAFVAGAAVDVESDVELDDIGAADGSVRVSVVFTGVRFGSR